MDVAKYAPFPPIAISDRSWPSRTLAKAPRWCSVDLRDGNQALVEPMGAVRKRRLFDALVRMGFREIEVGFPSASQTEYDFLRELIEGDAIPQDVTIQVLTQAREELIHRTFEALRGAPRAVVHLYNSTSSVQRRVVFGMDRAGIVDIAVRGARLVRELAEATPETELQLEYSPESFTQTELDFSVEICEAVMDVWEPTPDKPIILNLPATVEVATPNVYADQIEWFCRSLSARDCAVVSVHPHNDRGTAVAAAELAVLAGAERVEGTLFGNGERTGNVDIVTLAGNLLSQGVDPRLDLSDVSELVALSEYCTQMSVPARHPYAGELVYTAFSGSHQDAIKKGLESQRREASERWDVPYLPIDPADLGRSYEAVIRVNSQSGKGGVAYLLGRDRGLDLPRWLQVEFSRVIQALSENTGGELSSEEIGEAFEREYLAGDGRLQLLDYHSETFSRRGGLVEVNGRWSLDGQALEFRGHGRGPIEAIVDALQRSFGLAIQVREYSEHALSAGTDARAMAYVAVEGAGGELWSGVGRHGNIVSASLQAIVSAVNRGLGEPATRGIGATPALSDLPLLAS